MAPEHGMVPDPTAVEDPSSPAPLHGRISNRRGMERIYRGIISTLRLLGATLGKAAIW